MFKNRISIEVFCGELAHQAIVFSNPAKKIHWKKNTQKKNTRKKPTGKKIPTQGKQKQKKQSLFYFRSCDMFVIEIKAE